MPTGGPSEQHGSTRKAHEIPNFIPVIFSNNASKFVYVFSVVVCCFVLPCSEAVLFCFLILVYAGPLSAFGNLCMYALKISYFVMVIYFGDYCREISYGDPRSNSSSTKRDESLDNLLNVSSVLGI